MLWISSLREIMFKVNVRPGYSHWTWIFFFLLSLVELINHTHFFTIISIL